MYWENGQETAARKENESWPRSGDSLGRYPDLFSVSPARYVATTFVAARLYGDEDEGSGKTPPEIFAVTSRCCR